MARFRGTYECTLDDKGRFVFPKKLRQNMPPTMDTFIITTGHEKCLYLHPLDEWEKKENEYEKLNEHRPEHRLFLRLLTEGIDEVSWDNQFRVMISSPHIRYAGLPLRGLIRVSGSFNKIEIWDPEEYIRYKNQPENNRSFDEVSASVLGGSPS
ncbi:MAG: division/cell wall cluster transcriptional repressor MraZ [Ignavibacteria bacterium]|nr:division/cell wall cluster transcriptional repressor MraZ [Ignavibacteria bacterium]